MSIIKSPKKTCCLLLFLTAILLLAGLKPGLASTWRGDSLINECKNAPWKIGPFRLKMVLSLSNAGYDSNVYGTITDPVKDFGFIAGPALTVYLPLKKRILFSFVESPQYVYFLKTKRERTWNNSFGGQVHYLFNKVLLSFGISFSDAKQRINTEIEIRPRVKAENIEGTVLWQPLSKISFALKLSKNKQSYSNYESFNLSSLLDRNEEAVSLITYYQVSSLRMFYLNLEYRYFNFSDPQSLLDSRGYTISGGLEFSPTGNTRGKIGLGYRLIDPLAAGGKNYGGFIADIGLSIKLLKILTIRASFNRDFPYSYLFENTHYVMNLYQLGSSLYFFKKIRLDFDYRSGHNIYPEKKSSSDVGQPQAEGFFPENKYNSYSTGLFYKLKGNIGIGVMAGRWTNKANYYLLPNISRDYLTASLTYDF